jgi:hypothetical protein
MNAKHYLPTILICATIFLFYFKSYAQNSSDEIKIVNGKFWGCDAIQNGKTLTYNQLIKITRENPESCKYISKAYGLKGAGIFLGFVGGCGMGFSLGYALGRVIYDSPFEMKIFFPVAIAGVCLVACSITFDALATQNLRKGVDIFNKSIKQKNNANIDIGFMPNGMFLKLNF